MSYRIGIIGCGTMGRSHVRTYDAIERADVVANVDMVADAASAFANEHGTTAYTDHEAMLAEEELDVVSVCTWHSTHAELTIAACEAGVSGVILEKPMATNMGETRDILDAAERNDVALIVSHQRRHDPVHEETRAAIQDGAIGQPQLVRVGYRNGLLNWGTHLIDMARYVLGDPEPAWVSGHVERRTDRYERELAIEDNCTGTVAFEDGSRLIVEMDVPDPDVTDTRLQFYGNRGVCELALGSTATVTSIDGTRELAPEGDRGNRHAMTEEFFDLLDGERTDHRCLGNHAAPTMEIMMGLYESARTRQLVEFPLRTRANPLALLIEEELPPEYPGGYDIRLPYKSIRD